ncbi:hypothetical protein STVA_04200 [Allostella vacuolata]|nr:hypothetical protein STVA_04200 [Stella vacuolata]
MITVPHTAQPRMVRVTPAAAAHPGRPAIGRQSLALAVLLVVLPMFGQLFHYLVELPPPYFLSKAWPVLMLPLALYALVALDLPHKAMFSLLLAYTMGVSPLLGMIYFGHGYLAALTTTVKIWPFTYYFALAAMLVWLRPDARTITRAVIILGALTYILMWLLWMFAPNDWYVSDPAKGKLLIFENERGNRIYMPMFFGIIFLFYLARRLCALWEWWALPAMIGVFASLVLIFKQRVSILAAVIVVYAIIISSTQGALRRFLVACGLLGASAIIALLSGSVAEELAGSLGGSLSVRVKSFALAIDYLGSDPLRWLFGVGATTRFGEITLADIFGNKQFYLADLGWLGIVFEYGLVGAILLIGVYFVGLLFAWQTARADGTPLIRALADYTFFLFLTSAVYSFVFTPGELATIMGLAAYLRSLGPTPRTTPKQPMGTTPARRGSAWLAYRGSQPAAAAPARSRQVGP